LFPPADHEALATVLRGLKGRFILTLNDTPQARALYAGCRIETAGLSYSLAGSGKSKRVREIIVTG
jgi:DNA adenine methylase